MVDFSNAFDMVPKRRLIRKMEEAGYDRTLVNAIRNLMTDTHIQVHGKMIPIERGTP